MTNEQRMAFLMHLESLIFASKIANTDITKVFTAPQWAPFIASGGNGRFFNGGLRGFDIDLRLGATVIQLRVLEQNPQKIGKGGVFSQYAVLAQQGHRIVWIINRALKNDAFMGRIQDGLFIASAPRATYNAPTYQPPVQQNYAAQSVNAQSLPEVPPDMDIPEYVMSSLDEPEIDASLLADLESDIDTGVSYDDFTDDSDLE